MEDISYTRKTTPIDAGDVFVIDYRGDFQRAEYERCEKLARELYEACVTAEGVYVALIQLGPIGNTVGLE